MTTNIDRAAEVLWLLEPHLSDSECDDQARELAQALADDGLLMPDLPGPIGEISAQRYGGNPDARWIGYYDDSGERTVAGLIDAYPDEVDTPEGVMLTPELARQYAAALLAAADYAERNQE